MDRVFAHTFTGSLFSEPVLQSRHRHALAYQDRDIAIPVQVLLPEFVDYGLDIRGFIHNLGWGSLLQNPPSLVCPELVRYFYSNLRSFGLHSRSFTTVMFGHQVTIPVEDLGQILDLPSVGESLSHSSELWLFNFNIAEEFVQLTGLHPGPDLSLPVNLVLPHLRVLHFAITRIFLPRTQALDRIVPLDLWIMAHAVWNVPLNYSILIFGVFITYADSSYPGPLPLGPLITRLAVRLGVTITSFRTENPSFLMLTDQVLDECEIAIGGDGLQMLILELKTVMEMTVKEMKIVELVILPHLLQLLGY
ncbi:unnamed protein product [Linum trigynum]|uniref:Uncharacterized protein n=1 Tax=Linum trigynum TaxID=586398 RepID=A0AAV2GPJ0_9ROSI